MNWTRLRNSLCGIGLALGCSLCFLHSLIFTLSSWRVEKVSECFQLFLDRISSGQSEDVCHLSCSLRCPVCTVMWGFGSERNILLGFMQIQLEISLLPLRLSWLERTFLIREYQQHNKYVRFPLLEIIKGSLLAYGSIKNLQHTSNLSIAQNEKYQIIKMFFTLRIK